MADTARWQRLDAELARWRDAGRVAGLWLRDDDAVAPTPALERLLAASGRHRIPATLAVIPAFAEAALAERLRPERGVTVAVHGWAHENHAPPDRKKEELGVHRPIAMVLADLARGRAVVESAFGSLAIPMLVPPWNRIGADLLPLLPGLGLTTLSVFGRAGPGPVHCVNTHVDLIDWHGGRGGRDHDELVAALVDELRWRRTADSSEPVGILAHHLVHDEPAWLFLDRLFEATSSSEACRWLSARDLVR